METIDYCTRVLACLGIVCFSVLGIGTVFVWGSILWITAVEKAPSPRGLWYATKAAVKLQLTRKKSDYAARYVCEQIAKGERESIEFRNAIARYLPARHNRNF